MGGGRGRGAKALGEGKNTAVPPAGLLCRTGERWRWRDIVAQCKAARDNGVICQDVGVGVGGGGKGALAERGGLISLLRYDAHATLGGPLWFGGLRGS